MLQIGTHAGPQAVIGSRVCLPEDGAPFPMLIVDNLTIGMNLETAERVIHVLAQAINECRERRRIDSE